MADLLPVPALLAAVLLLAPGPAAAQVRAVHVPAVPDIRVDEYDGRWIEGAQGPCRLVVRASRDRHFGISVQGEGCDPLSDTLRPVAAAWLHTLIDTRTVAHEQISLSIDLWAHRELLPTWAQALKSSPAWAARPRRKTPWDTSEYPLVARLLKDTGLFAAYDSTLGERGYALTAVHIEKLAYPTMTQLKLPAEQVAALGMRMRDTLPVPLMTTLAFTLKADRAAPPVKRD
jgi:hypothetical protein